MKEHNIQKQIVYYLRLLRFVVICTDVMVGAAKLKTQGIDKNDLTREEFLEHAWEWTEEYGGVILEQLKKLEQVLKDGSVHRVEAYDDNGNRTLTTVGADSAIKVYDKQDRLVSAGSLSYQYNRNGDLKSKIETTTSETTLYNSDVFAGTKESNKEFPI